MLEEQTFDMNRYREQKDRLEYEAMMRNPETAYLAQDEEFDRQMDELGWSPSDLVTMTGMYVDWASYSIKKSVRDWFRELLELVFFCSSADNRHAPDVLSRRALHTGTGSLRLFPVGRLPLDAFGMVQPLHTDLPVASGIGPVQHHTGENPDTDAPAGHRGNAG